MSPKPIFDFLKVCMKKTMYGRFAFILLAYLLSGPSLTLAQSDSKSQEILKSVSSKYKSYKTVQANFKLTRVDQKTKKPEVMTGTITVSAAKFNFVLGDQTVMSDGKITWTYLKESNEVQISENVPSENTITPTSIFTMYEKGFKTRFIAEKSVGGKPVQQIELVPEDARKNYSRILLQIDKTGKFVNEAKIFEKGGNIITYSIVKFSPNASVTEELFTFNKAKFPGVEIVDLR